jgi:hypothetical protein
MDSSETSQKSFVKHVFNFEDESKSEILNIIQYSLISLIPIIILNKTMSKYVPESDDKKGSLEISAEIIIQIIYMFLGLLLIHRIVTYFPTYSGIKYPEFNIIFIILAVLMITLSLQTKLGEKVSVLFDRLTELWEGKTKTTTKTVNGKQVTVKVTQPISGQQIQTSNQSAMNQSLYNDGTSINQLPSSSITQQLPDYNNMYQNNSNPLVNASSPGQTEGFMNEPMAANSGGGGAFGSVW